MMVFAYATGVGSNAPPFGCGSEGSGMQDGYKPAMPIKVVTLYESQPHPGPGGGAPGAVSGSGMLPVNPSVDGITAYRWPPHDGESAREKVRSLIAKSDARAAKFGTADGW